MDKKKVTSFWTAEKAELRAFGVEPIFAMFFDRIVDPNRGFQLSIPLSHENMWLTYCIQSSGHLSDFACV
jgi:hypothetical protein